METRPCEREDFNLGNDDDSSGSSLFYPTIRSKAEVSKFWSEFQCISNVTEVKVNGNYDTSIANQLMIAFEKCDDKNEKNITCAEEHEVDYWMQHRYIITVENQK